MNRYSLKFNENALEQRYLKYQHPREYQQYHDKYLVFMPAVILSCIWNFSFGFKNSAIGQIVLMTLLTIADQYGKHNKISHFEIFISLVQIEVTFVAMFFFQDMPDNSRNGQIKFILGLALANYQMSYSAGINFILKTITMISVTLIIAIFNLELVSLLQPSVQIYLMMTLILIQTTYLREKEKRLKYLAEAQIIQWNVILNNSLGVSIVKYNFDQAKNKIQLIYANQSAHQQDITNTPQLVKFLRTTFLRSQNHRTPTQSILSAIIKPHNGLNMEKISYALFKTSKFCEKFFHQNTDAPRSIDGFRKEENQQEQILNFKVVKYLDEVPCLMLIFKQDMVSQSTLNELELKQKNMMLTDFLKVVKDNCNKFLPCADQSRLNKFPRFYINQIHNTLINIRILQNEINLHFYQPLKTFYISNIMRRLNNAFQPYCRRYLIELQIRMIGFNDNSSMVSIEWAVYQCLYNLLLNAVQNSVKGNLVKLTLFQSKDVFKNNIIIVQIVNEGANLLPEKLKLLPLIRPKTIDQYTHNCKFNHNQLGLAVCIQILTIIGYTNTIIINQDNDRTSVFIKLCQNISECRKIIGHQFVETIKVSDHIKISRSLTSSSTSRKRKSK